MTKQEKTDQAEAIQSLRELLKPGDTVHTILRNVSRSGMTRHISLKVPGPNGDIRDITYTAARALGYRLHNDGGLVVGGCGMDMGFAVVYDLGRVLWPEGFKTWEGYWRNEPMDFDPDGGYALRQRWL